jgi:hypothetical protein
MDDEDILAAFWRDLYSFQVQRSTKLNVVLTPRNAMGHFDVGCASCAAQLGYCLLDEGTAQLTPRQFQ